MQPMKNKTSLFRPNPPKVLAVGFVVIILLGAALLSIPEASSTGARHPYLDSLFMSTSAVCVTGLSVIDAGNEYSLFGQTVLILLVQIGGIGFTTMATLAALIMKKRISLSERLILQEALNQSSIDGIVRLIRKVLLYAFAIEAVGALLFIARWMFEMPFHRAVYFGIFHSISIFNNAGFDLFGGMPGRPGSLMHYVEDPYINFVTIPLIFLGGLGFIVISDLLDYPRSRKLTLHSKVVLSVSFGLIVFGMLVILALEYTNPATLQPLSATGKALGSLFQSVTARSAGISTLNVGELRQATQFFITLMMFIGAAPGSTGGGIKVTTFAILLGTLLARMQAKEDVVLFRRRLANERVYKAVTFTMFSFLLIIIASMILSITENYPFLGILFEATSAYGTAGMSTGLTPNLSLYGKILIMLLMFIGRLGPVTLAYALTRPPGKERFRYPEGKIAIG